MKGERDVEEFISQLSLSLLSHGKKNTPAYLRPQLLVFFLGFTARRRIWVLCQVSVQKECTTAILQLAYVCAFRCFHSMHERLGYRLNW